VPTFSHTPRPSARGFFIVMPHERGPDAVWRSQLPDHCPLRDSQGTCRITEHHRRHRKTGPGFPLLVIRCAVHRKHFTLYPPGYGPYLRKPVVDLAPDGTCLLGPPDTPLEPFDGTLFDAALDAAQGKPWARDSVDADPPPEQWWSTQGRHLDLTVRLLGLLRGLQKGLRATIAATLCVKLLLLRELSTHIATTPGYRAKGRAAVEVLLSVTAGRSCAHRLLHCAHLIGHLALPLLWNETGRTLERLPFAPPCAFPVPKRGPPDPPP